MLKKAVPNSTLLSVPPDIASSLDDYSTDPAGMESHRVRLAEAIEAGHRPGFIVIYR